MATSEPGTDLRVLDRPAAGSSPALDSVQAAATPVAKTFAIVLINFTNLATQPWTKATVEGAVTGSTSSLKAFYEEESKGRMTVGATVYGWYTIDATTAGCDWRTWHDLGWDKATAAGVNLNGVHERDVHVAADERLRLRRRRLRAREVHVHQRLPRRPGDVPRGRAQPRARARERAQLRRRAARG